jgi:hypothetical protein
MLGNPLQRFPGEVEAIKRGVAIFQMRDDTNRLGVVVEAAKIAHRIVQPLLARMAKGRVAKVMREGQGLR